MDVTPTEAEAVLRKYSIDTLIHGHTHRPAVHRFTVDDKTCKRIVLGDWGNSGWYVELADAPLLQQFAISH